MIWGMQCTKLCNFMTSTAASGGGQNCKGTEFWCVWASLEAQMGNNLPAMQETGVQSLGQEDPLEEGMATHFSILAWRIPWIEQLGGL